MGLLGQRKLAFGRFFASPKGGCCGVFVNFINNPIFTENWVEW